MTKYIKSVLWGVAVRLSYIQDAWCIKVKSSLGFSIIGWLGAPSGNVRLLNPLTPNDPYRGRTAPLTS